MFDRASRGLLMRSVPAHSAETCAASCFVGSYAGGSNHKPSVIS
jgi:hypothetical protein